MPGATLQAPHAPRSWSLDPRDGNRFGSSVYRDPISLLLGKTAGASITVAAFESHAQVQTRLREFRDNDRTTTYAYIEPGAADGLELFAFGTTTAGQTVILVVEDLWPVYDLPATESEEPTTWVVRTRGTITFELGTGTMGAEGDKLTGVASADLVGDNVTANTLIPSTVAATTDPTWLGLLLLPNDNTRLASAMIPSLGAPIVSIKLSSASTAVSAGLLGHRYFGLAQNIR